jgi:hypothetical protein
MKYSMTHRAFNVEQLLSTYNRLHVVLQLVMPLALRTHPPASDVLVTSRDVYRVLPLEQIGRCSAPEKPGTLRDDFSQKQGRLLHLGPVVAGW